MAGKEIAVKKYVARLSSEEHHPLEMVIRKGKGPARRLLKAPRFVEGRCLGSWRRVERQQDHCRLGHQRVHGLPRA